MMFTDEVGPLFPGLARSRPPLLRTRSDHGVSLLGRDPPLSGLERVSSGDRPRMLELVGRRRCPIVTSGRREREPMLLRHLGEQPAPGMKIRDVRMEA